MILSLNSDLTKLKKVSIHDDHCLTVEFLCPVTTEDSVKEDEYNVKLHSIMHPDLKELFKRMAVHLALATEYVGDELIKLNNLKEPYDTQAGHILFLPFECRHVTRNWKDTKSGIVLSGVRRLKNKRTVSINTPFIEIDPDKSSYPYIREMLDVLGLFDDEVFGYMNGTRFAARQGELQEEKKPWE